MYELYYLDLATGLRRGELLGLKWTDVDLDHGVLKIQRAISRQNGKVVEAPLKTKNAYRTLPLSADAIDVLKMQKCKIGNSEWVFPSPTGGPMSPDSVLHMLQRVLKRAGLPRIRFHDLRHTFATMALQNGVDVKTVSSMLGSLLGGFHAGHLRPRYHRRADESGANNGQYPLPCRLMLSATRLKCSPSQGHFHLTHSGSIPAGYSPVVM
ncbi:MAG: site-specific integrase [Oscillospiraceae bacterium]